MVFVLVFWMEYVQLLLSGCRLVFDDDDGLFLQNDRPMKGVYVLLSAETIDRDSHHCKSLTHHKQGLNLCRI